MLDKVSPLSPLVLVVMAAALVACPRVEPINEVPDEPGLTEDRQLSFETIGEGIHAPIDAGEYVFRDREEWEAMARQFHDLDREVDFDRDAVLLAAYNATTGGYSLRFGSVEVLDGEVVATYIIRRPGPDCMVTQALTRPYQIVLVAGLPDTTVRFQQRSESYSC